MQLFNVIYFCFSIIVFGYIFSFGTCLSSSQEALGQIGDFFGGILNPLIGMVVLYYLIKSYHAQKEELNGTKIALNEQKNLMEIQNFENHFFKLMDQFSYILKETEYRGKFSSEAFAEILDEDDLKELLNLIQKHLFVAKYKNIYETNQSFPYKYINFLLLILKFISENKSINETNKQKYFDVIKVNLSKNELEFLSFHFLSDDSYIHLVKKYNFFEYLDFDSSRINKFLCNVYKISCGGNRE